MDIKKKLYFLKNDLKRVEELINSNFKSDITLIPKISSYIANGGGKRLRPILLMVSARLCGYDDSECDIHLKLSCVLEYIHAATLLHDDVIDFSELRRGNPSANAKWGNEASVLVGDFLFSKAFLMVSKEPDTRLYKLLSEASIILAEGEVKQLMNKNNIHITEENYLDVIGRKTASLIAVACRMGGIISKTTDDKLEALTQFGQKIGYAFQLMDDVLDFTSTETILGKPITNDIKGGTITLPVIYLYRHCDETKKKEIEALLNSEGTEEKIKENISKLRDMVEKSGAIEYTLKKAENYVQEAKNQLDVFNKSEFYSSMTTIADYIFKRKL